MFYFWLVIPFFVFFFPCYASAYTWKFTSQPRQCQNISIDVQGEGQPPYSLLLIPSGPSSLPNNTEVRTIQNISFPGTSTSLSFKLNYPENSSFVAVVSDSSGFGTGGTSTPVTVLSSSDSSCYDPTKGIQLPWLFYVEPSGGIVQCERLRWWWGQDLVNGTVNFYGVIPGGNAFQIPSGPVSTNTVTGTGFDWTVDITGGTNILIIGGDDRGIGTGGVAPFTVGYTLNSSCLSSTSPSSTAGSPAGGSYPTSTSDSSRGSSTRLHTGAIAGGVAVGLVAFAVALFLIFRFRRRGYSAVSTGRPVNVLHDEEDDGYVLPQDVSHQYSPDPYLVPDSTIGGTSGVASTRNRLSSATTADFPYPQTPSSATTTTRNTRKSVPLAQMRPVNIFQHDDAGPSEVPTSAGEPETIELPPAYTNLRSAQRPPVLLSPPASARAPSKTTIS